NDVVSVSTGSSSWLAVKENGQLWSSANGTYQESDSKSYEPIKIMDDIMIPQVVSLDSDTISFPLAPTPTPQPTSLKIYCNEPSLSTTVGNSFLIGAALTDEDGNKGDISKIGFSVSDKNILSSVAVTENDGIAYCSFKAEAVGTADIKISNAATGETAALTFTVNSQTKNAYTVDTVPAASAYGIGCNFSNFNGITIANYKKSPNSDGSVDISFDAYNSNYCYGVVEVYNADGQPFNTKVIDKYKDETSVSGVWDRLTKIAKEALELISGAEKLSDEFWYKSTTVTKETPVSIKVPKGGYIKITSDTRESANCGIINGIDILFQMKAAVDKIGESTKAGTEEKLPEAVITKLQKDINKYESEWAKSCTKSFVTGTIDTADKAANFGEAMQDMLDDGLKDIAVSAMKDAAVGMIEDKITDWFEKSAGPFGAALKQIFTQTSVGNLYEQCTSFNNCANSGAITIHNPSANTRVCSDVTVSCTMSADTALDVYKIDTMSASVRNIKSQNVSEFKDSTYTAAYEINLVENGKLVQPKGKATVTIALPDDLIGYNGEITVYRVEADGSLTKMNGVSNGAAITFETDHFSTYILTASGAEAKLPEAEEGQTVVNGDTIVSEWAAPEVQEAFDENLVPDILHGADLTKKVDRAEFAAIAVTLYENLSKKTAQTGENPFGDISGNYCEDDILKAYNLGITNGITNVTFEPSTLISREQAATMLTRAYKKSEFPSWTLATDGDYPLNYMGVTKYADDDEISDYAKESVYFMTRWDILNGVDNSHFAPKNNTTLGESYGYATREQAVVIALRSAKHL
ncbi:MAG: S-layer homology domain-containing protein, partial [Candidatus Ornithomonoglobus sp.]